MKPSVEIILVSVLIDGNVEALQSIIVGSFVLANVLWHACWRIVRNGFRHRENPVAVAIDVEAA